MYWVGYWYYGHGDRALSDFCDMRSVGSVALLYTCIHSQYPSYAACHGYPWDDKEEDDGNHLLLSSKPLVERSQVKIVKFPIIRLSIQFLGDGHGLMKIGPQSRKSGSYRTTIYSWRFSLLYEREKFEVQEEKRKPWLVFFYFFIIRIWWGWCHWWLL